MSGVPTTCTYHPRLLLLVHDDKAWTIMHSSNNWLNASSRGHRPENTPLPTHIIACSGLSDMQRYRLCFFKRCQSQPVHVQCTATAGAVTFQMTSDNAEHVWCATISWRAKPHALPGPHHALTDIESILIAEAADNVVIHHARCLQHHQRHGHNWACLRTCILDKVSNVSSSLHVNSTHRPAGCTDELCVNQVCMCSKADNDRRIGCIVNV